MALIWASCLFCSCSVPSCAGSPSLVYCTGVLVLHGPNLGSLCCIWWCGLLHWVSFIGVLCGGPCVSSVCSFCVSVVCEGVCSIFGVSVFNVCEVGFDSPTKLVSGGPRFMVDPTLRHCTFSHGLD